MNKELRNGWRISESTTGVDFAHSCAWEKLTLDFVKKLRDYSVYGIFRDADSLNMVLRDKNRWGILLKITPCENAGMEIKAMRINPSEFSTILMMFCNPAADDIIEARNNGVVKFE